MEIIKNLSCIGNKVSFNYPGNEADKKGILKDRAAIERNNVAGSVPYWDVVDLSSLKSNLNPNG